MSFREKLEKLGRGLPCILEPDNSHKNATVSPYTGLPNPSGLRLLTPTSDTRLSDSVPQSATSLFSNDGEDNCNKLTRVEKNSEALSPITRKVNGDDWAGVKALQKTLDPDIKNSLKPMVDEFIRCIELFERAIKGGGEQKKLRKEFDQLFHKIDLQYSKNPALTMAPSIERLCRSICSRLHHARETSGGGSAKWYLKITGAFEPQEVLLNYRRIRGDLKRLSVTIFPPT
ncbi:unnamed protein product [Rhizoctonia solani]|uniref:Uncharacterized protein n=1 Tax=Rhizoctonia solani TaxID=456999 RepID=A0A8H3AMI2_9AGAM|nr:unnamed protein product [Rhizoctonia solani]